MNLHLQISFSFLLHLVLASVSIYVFYRYYIFAFKTPKPSGPAAIGRAMGALAVCEILGSYFIWFLFKASSVIFSGEIFDLGSKSLSVVLFYMAALTSGFIASRTSENTQSMNYKMQAALGFIPHTIIGFVVFTGSIYNHLVFWPYIPLVVAGGLIQIKCSKAKA